MLNECFRSKSTNIISTTVQCVKCFRPTACLLKLQPNLSSQNRWRLTQMKILPQLRRSHHRPAFRNNRSVSGQMRRSSRRNAQQCNQQLTGGRRSPILSTLNMSWNDISSTQQKYYQRKAKETIFAALSVISPGQEKDIWANVRKEARLEAAGKSACRRKSFDPSSEVIDSLVKAYYQAESWQTKRQILSVFADDFSRAELTNLIPTLSKWQIDQARKHATEAAKGQSIRPDPIFRPRISRAQVEHFIDYISRPENGARCGIWN